MVVVAKNVLTIIAALVLAMTSMAVISMLSKKIVDIEEDHKVKVREALDRMKFNVVGPQEVTIIPEEVIEIEVEYGEIK
jgi:hypothetical protein